MKRRSFLAAVLATPFAARAALAMRLGPIRRIVDGAGLVAVTVAPGMVMMFKASGYIAAGALVAIGRDGLARAAQWMSGADDFHPVNRVVGSRADVRTNEYLVGRFHESDRNPVADWTAVEEEA